MSISEGQWNLLSLRRASQAESITVSDSGVAGADGNVLFGVDAIGHRHLLVPVRDGEVAEDHESLGVQVGTRRLSDAGRDAVYADLVCLKPVFAQEFSHIVTDVLHAVRKGAHPGTVCRNSLEKWRDLLRAGSTGRLDDITAVGLFGELFVLLRLARISPTVVRGWTGPEGGRFDFVSGDTAIEVKTSTRRHGRLIEINGETQLDAPPGVALHLMYLRLERVPAGGERLADLYRALLERGVSGTELEQRLGLLGIATTDMGDDQKRFRVVEARLYPVAHSFPRIVPSSFIGLQLPPGTFRLQYVIDLSAEPPLPLTDPESDSLLQKFAKGLAGAGTA